MSMSRDVTTAVRQITDAIKKHFEQNINAAVRDQMITLESDKIPGICQIANASVDQGLLEGSTLLTNTIQAYSKRLNKG